MYIANIQNWFLSHWIPLGMTVAIALLGIILARVLKSLVLHLCEKAGFKPAVRDLLAPVAFWSMLAVSSFACVGIVAAQVLHLDITWFKAFGSSLLRAALVFSVGAAAINLGLHLLKKCLEASSIDATLHPFLCSAAKVLSMIVLSVACIELLGIPTASMLAAMASVGLALSLSVQDHLSNLIGGVVVLITKPFVKGNYVDLGGTEGLVDEIGLIYTVLRTFDNKKIYIPNNDAAKARIVNHSENPLRRLELVFSIGYHDDYERACALILQAAKETGLVKEEPAPLVRMLAHADHSVQIVCRIWVDWSDYAELGFLMREQVKIAFDQAGISIPYNQIDLHIVSGQRQ